MNFTYSPVALAIVITLVFAAVFAIVLAIDAFIPERRTGETDE